MHVTSTLVAAAALMLGSIQASPVVVEPRQISFVWCVDPVLPDMTPAGEHVN